MMCDIKKKMYLVNEMLEVIAEIRVLFLQAPHTITEGKDVHQNSIEATTTANSPRAPKPR